MKNRLRLLSLFLTSAMLLPVISGCTEQKTPETRNSSTNTSNTGSASTPGSSSTQTSNRISEKPITLTYWTGMDNNSAAVLSNFSDMLMYQEMEALSNIKLEFKHPPVGQEREQFNLMMASRDLPDLIEYGWTNGYPGGVEKAISDNIIIKLDELVEEHAPNFKALLAADESVNRQARTDSSTLYAFPAIGTGHVKVTGGPLIRKDWLDDLGLPLPETLEDWTHALTQFKDTKGAESPITGQIGNFGASDWLIGAFGIGARYYVDHDIVKFGPLQDEYRQYIELLRSWYEKGLLDPDFSANNAKAVESRVTSGQTGALFGNIGGGIGTYMNAMKDIDPAFSLVAAQYPVAVKGEEPLFLDRAWDVRTSGMVAITTANKYPAESVRWADYLYGQEGNLLKNFGVEGLTYEFEGDFPKYTELITNNPDGLSIAHALGKHVRASTPSPGLIDSRYHQQYFALPQQQTAFELWAPVADNALQVKLPPITPTQEEAEEHATISTAVNSYVEEMFVRFVMGIEPMSKFDEFVAQLKKMNVERVIEINQKALERYNSR